MKLNNLTKINSINLKLDLDDKIILEKKPDYILQLKNITLEKNNKKILNNVSFNLEKGKLYALVGPNGAGKSTTGSLIMGLDGFTDFDGEIWFENENISKLNVFEKSKKGISLAWQDPARFIGLKVKDYLISGNKENVDISEALSLVGLNPLKYLERTLDKTLSGGERKRIELAGIITLNPKLVILDEPDSGVDIEALKNVIDVIKYLQKNGCAILMITHNHKFLEMVDDVFLLCGGIIKEKNKGYFSNNCINCINPNKYGENANE